MVIVAVRSEGIQDAQWITVHFDEVAAFRMLLQTLICCSSTQLGSHASISTCMKMEDGRVRLRGFG